MKTENPVADKSKAFAIAAVRLQRQNKELLRLLTSICKTANAT